MTAEIKTPPRALTLGGDRVPSHYAEPAHSDVCERARQLPGGEATESQPGESRSDTSRDIAHDGRTRRSESREHSPASTPPTHRPSAAGASVGDRGADARERGAFASDGPRTCAADCACGGTTARELERDCACGGTTAEGGGCAGASSLVKRSQPDKCAQSREILDVMEVASEPWRRWRARSHRVRAAVAADHGRSTTADWHNARARGLEQRYEKRRQCGMDTAHVLCRGCGSVHARPVGCGRHSICASCRGSRAAKRARALREGLARHAASFGAKATSRHGWRWRWVTLSPPNPADVERVATAIPRAWAFLRRDIRALGGSLEHEVTFARSLEITASDGGHAHLHVLAWCPYLPESWLRVRWANALRRAGLRTPDRDASELLAWEAERHGAQRAAQVKRLLLDGRRRELQPTVPWAYGHVMAVDSRDDDALTAYAAKGVVTYVAKGTAIDYAELEAACAIERALYGRRTWQGSHGLLTPPPAVCTECETSSWDVRIERQSWSIGREIEAFAAKRGPPS